MSEFGSGPDFMDKFDLHKTPKVNDSVDKLRREGERIPETKDARVEAHFRRIDRALEGKRELFTRLTEKRLLDDYTINLQAEDGTENTEKIDRLVMGLFESEKEILRRRGMGADLEQYPDRPTPEDYEKYRQQIYGKKVEQEKTLSKWTEYFGSEEANHYPIWFKYLALRSLRKMGKRDRDTETYSKRSSDTLQPFPDLSREALAKTFDALTRQSDLGTTLDLDKQDEYSDEELKAQAEIDRLADKGDFARLYAHFQGEIERARRERGEDTAGEWRHFPKGSDASVLCKTLEGKGTEWCTAGVDVARSQLSNGEFYIYYTFDEEQKPTVPRVAIFLVNGQISEVRGVYGKDQDLELPFVDIAREKYQEFPGHERYEKADHDMKLLSKIEDKVKAGEELNKEDLIFLYEIDSKIEGFGHGADPRVVELQATRNPKEDAPIVLECQPEEIAWNRDQIRESTRNYIGPLFPGVFQLPNIEHIYTTFPETEIHQGEFQTSGKTGAELNTELQDNNVYTDRDSEFMLNSPEFVVSPSGETISIVRLKVRDLFSDEKVHTYPQILTRAFELGLELLPHETGADLLLGDNEKNQPRLGEWFTVFSEKITDWRGYPCEFRLARDDGGLWLTYYWVNPTRKWYPSHELMFRLRKDSQES